MELLVDSREPASLRALFPGARVATLDNGDFQIVAEGGRPAVVFERKTYGDFVSSANGTRLGDQTARLLSLCREHDCRPILLFEHARVHGWTTGAAVADRERKFVDCCLNKFALEGFSVFRTRDERHTADVVSWVLERCRKNKVPRFAPSLEFKNAVAAPANVKKSANLTPGKTWEAMLTAARGVSAARAAQIAKRFPTARALVEYFAEPAPKRAKFPVEGVGEKTALSLRRALCGEAPP